MNIWTVSIKFENGNYAYLRFDNSEDQFEITDLPGEAILLPQADANTLKNKFKEFMQVTGINLDNIKIEDVSVVYPSFLTVKASTIYGFDKQVNLLMNCGYAPQGGMQVQEGSFYMSMSKPLVGTVRAAGTARAYRQPQPI